MAVTNFTPLLGLALPTTGDLSGTWGATVNTAITDLLDDAVAGTVTLSADADATLTTTNGADNQARNAVILWTASNGATTRNVTAPAQSKAYIVINAGTGSVVIRGAGPTTGVTVASGFKALVAWNGSDFVKVASSLVSLTSDVTGILPIANGGTATATPALVQGSNITITGTWPNQTIAAAGAAPQVYPGVGIANSTGSAWGTSYSTSGSGTVVALATSPAITTSITTASTTFTALAGATTLLTLGGTGASAVLAIPSTLEQSSTTGALTVAGGVYVAKKLTAVGATATGALTVTGAITATGTITSNFSDDRLKTKLGNISDALAKVKSLSGFYYEANETAQALGYEVKREVGVSAQSVQAVMPEVVAPAPIDSQYLTIHYEKLVPLLIEAIKELELKLTALENK